MRKLCIILGFTCAILAVILSVTPFVKLAIIPALVALVCGLLTLYFSNKQNKSKKVVQYILFFTIVALGITTYNSIFDTSEVGNTEDIEQLEKTSEEDAIEELNDLNIDDIE